MTTYLVGKQKHDYATKKRIVDLHLEGKSNAEIASRLGISGRSIWTWVKRYKNGEGLQSRHAGGQPRKTTAEQDMLIINFAKENPHLKTGEILERLQKEVKCSVRTILSRLHKAGLYCADAACKPSLTNKQKEQRLNFGLEFRGRDGEFWQRYKSLVLPRSPTMINLKIILDYFNCSY